MVFSWYSHGILMVFSWCSPLGFKVGCQWLESRVQPNPQARMPNPRPGNGMPESSPSPGIRFLLGGAGGRLLAGRLELKVFLVGITLFAGLALFVGGDATFVPAFLAFGGGLFAASQLLRRLIGGHNRAEHERAQARQDNQCFHQLHNLQSPATATRPSWAETARTTVWHRFSVSDATECAGIQAGKS